MSDQTKQQETRSLPATFAKNEFEKDAFILRQLVTKDFKIKYRRSVLGVAWSVLNPLLMMIVMAIVFSTIFGQGRNGSMTPEMYPLYLIVGNITFAVMSESTNQALTSIVGAAPLLKKVKVHRWVFPVQKVLFSLVNFCMGLGMMLSALTVFFRDVMHLWSVIITAWTYITPIFWTTDYIAQMPHLVRILMYANPMYNYLQFMRDIFLFQTTPSLMTFGMCVAWAVLALVIGYTVFHKSERKFILYI